MNKAQSYNLNRSRAKKIKISDKFTPELAKGKLLQYNITHEFRDDIGISRQDQVLNKEILLRRMVVANFLRHPITDTEYLDSNTKFSHITSDSYLMHFKGHQLGFLKITKELWKFKLTFTPTNE
jgi:hypothetical protein